MVIGGNDSLISGQKKFLIKNFELRPVDRLVFYLYDIKEASRNFFLVTIKCPVYLLKSQSGSCILWVDMHHLVLFHFNHTLNISYDYMYYR